MARMNIKILGISELKWTAMGEFIPKATQNERQGQGLTLGSWPLKHAQRKDSYKKSIPASFRKSP